ncbi:hypothetical protein [Photobacterium leiognathi]|uniref:hypothetical protein n=1 Tax=Photobacterium leiognathi TaxID=553611 RepID=UPI002980D8A6|nr:hypothetical protein [Photobacterium leiognathi]
MLTPRLYSVDEYISQGKSRNSALILNLELQIELPKEIEYNGEIDLYLIYLRTDKGIYPFAISATQGNRLNDKYLLECQFEDNINTTDFVSSDDGSLLNFTDAYKALLSQDNNLQLTLEVGCESEINVLNQIRNIKLISHHDAINLNVTLNPPD